MRDKIQGYEKQLSEMKASLLQKDQLSVMREQAYNELFQVIASSNSVKVDKLLVSKLRDLKTRHSELIASNGTGLQTFHALPDQEENV